MSMFPGTPAVVGPVGEVEEMVADDKEIRKMSLTEEHKIGIGERRWGFGARLDPNVTLEEYMYWAKAERELEAVEWKKYQAEQHADTVIGGLVGSVTGLFKKRGRHNTGVAHDVTPPATDLEKDKAADTTDGTKGSLTGAISPPHRQELDSEWRTAARALRTASWGGVFYLYVTDRTSLTVKLLANLVIFLLASLPISWAGPRHHMSSAIQATVLVSECSFCSALLRPRPVG